MELVDFKTDWDDDIFFLPLSSFLKQSVCKSSCASLTIGRLEQITCFLRSPQMERNFVPGRIMPRAPSIPNLGDLHQEIWGFGAKI